MSQVSEDHGETVKTAVEAIIKTHTEKFIREAVAEYEFKLREEIAKTVMIIYRFYTVDAYKENLVIHVKLGSQP